MNYFKIITMIAFSFGQISCGNYESNKAKTDATSWRYLFNGSDLEGWVPKLHHHELGDNYANTFSVENGKIRINYDEYGAFNDRFGHLFFEESFSSYHLKFEYRFTDQWLEDAPIYTYRNSGVMFHSQNPKTILKEQDWPISVEYQILAAEDNDSPRSTGNMCSPGTNVVYEGEIDSRHCIESASQTYKWDEWVNGDIIVYEDSLVVHMVNGDTVLKYSKPQIGGEVANGYDSLIKVDGKLLKEGYIGLQSEGQGIEFKEIRIKSLEN